MASPPPNQGPGGHYDPHHQQYQSQQPQQAYGQPDPYGQQQQPYQQPGYAPQGYPQGGVPTQPASAPPPTSSTAGHGSKARRRGYAEEQYEFGAGANAAGTPSSQGGILAAGVSMGGYPGPQQQENQFISPMGGATPAIGVQQPGYVVPPGMSGVGAGNIAAAAGGYEPPGGAPGMAGVTQQFGQMGLGQQQGIQKAQALNHLYSVDLMQQPFNVAELEFPPPEIVLPPNVWGSSSFWLFYPLTNSRHL